MQQKQAKTLAMYDSWIQDCLEGAFRHIPATLMHFEDTPPQENVYYYRSVCRLAPLDRCITQHSLRLGRALADQGCTPQPQQVWRARFHDHLFITYSVHDARGYLRRNRQHAQPARNVHNDG